jgi:N-acetyl-beta-hexosaminidase
MVDPVREWIPASRVYKYIDVCFMQKLNHLHLHLVDDQRFTLPSKAFPLLPTPD